MSGVGITKEQILEAIAKLEAEGKRPTMQGIRSLIGGSYSTLGPVLNEWKAQKQQPEPAQDEPSGEPMPVAMAEKLEACGKEIWAEALRRAEERLEAERKELQKMREKMAAERDEAIALADDTAEENEGLREEVTKLKEELEAVRKELVESQAEVTGLKGQNEGLREQFEALVAKIQPVQPVAEASV